MDWSGKWKAIIMGRIGPRVSCVKMVSNRQIFIVGYLQFVDRQRERERERERLQAALCSNGYRASTLARKLYRRLSMTGISTPLKNDFVEPSRSSWTAVHDWYLNTAKERFCGAIRKLIDGCPGLVSQHR